MCIVCETIVQYIEAMIDDKSSVEKIESLMKKVCNFLPESMKAEVVKLSVNAKCCLVFVA